MGRVDTHGPKWSNGSPRSQTNPTECGRWEGATLTVAILVIASIAVDDANNRATEESPSSSRTLSRADSTPPSRRRFGRSRRTLYPSMAMFSAKHAPPHRPAGAVIPNGIRTALQTVTFSGLGAAPREHRLLVSDPGSRSSACRWDFADRVRCAACSARGSPATPRQRNDSRSSRAIAAARTSRSLVV